MTRLSLELGGNAPVLVFPDVDLEAGRRRRGRGEVPQRRPGVRRAAAVPRREGRRPTSSSIHAAAVAGALRVGSGPRSGVAGGPAHQRAAARSRRGAGRSPRARPARRSASAAPGRRSSRAAISIEPTVVGDVKPSMPHLRGRDLRTGDAGGVLRRSGRSDRAGERHALRACRLRVDATTCATAIRASERLEFGMIGVNEWTPQAVEAPFVGLEGERHRPRGRARRTRGVSRNQARCDRRAVGNGRGPAARDAAHARAVGSGPLEVVAIVNINNVPPVAVYGWASLALWLLAFSRSSCPKQSPC